MSYMNLVYGKARYESFVAQWLEHLIGVWKVIGSIPAWNSGFFFVRSWQVGYIIFLISSLSLKFTIFLYLS